MYNAGTLGGDCEGFHLGFDSSPNETQPPPEKSGTSASPPTSPTAGSVRIYFLLL